MSATFSFSRLGKLISKQFHENLRFYTFSTLALLGLLSIVFAFWMSATGPNYDEEGAYLILLFGLFISGSVFASISFNMLGSKEKGLYWLITPATHFEKLVCTLFFHTIAFTTVFLLCFFLVKSISFSILNQYIQSHPNTSFQKLNLPAKAFRQTVGYFLCAYFAVQSLYFLGSIYFKRYAFIVTTVAVSAIIFLYVFYISTIEDSMNGSWHFFSLSKYDEVSSSYRLYSVSPFIRDLVKYAILFLWAPIFWVTTWFRLKEKEI